MLAWASFMGGTEHTNPHPPKRRAGNYALNFLQGKSSRQDRRRSDKYELNTENTNNPNTAKARITITRLPSKHPFILQPAVQLPLLRFQPLNSSRRDPLSTQHHTPAIQLQHSALQS